MEAMCGFLTEENLKLHKDYLCDLRLKYSILTKSNPDIADKIPAEIQGMRLGRDFKSEALRLLVEIMSHDTYFSSFASCDTHSKEIKNFYSSEADFRYKILELAMSSTHGFVYILLDKKGKPYPILSDMLHSTYVTDIPVLAIDICEHAYFADYGFNRYEYLKRAISHLDISKIYT